MAAASHIHPADCCAPAKTDPKSDTDVSSMSVKELKAYLIERKIDSSDCIEKSDFVAKVKQAMKDGIKPIGKGVVSSAASSSSGAAAATGAGSSGRTCILGSREVGPLKCNMSIIGDPVTKQCVLVDPGGDTADILALIKQLGVTIVQIVVTHAHFDHIASAGDIKTATGAPIYLNKADLQLWQFFPMQYALIGLPAPKSALPAPDQWISDGDKLKVLDGVCIHTPGHSPGSTCFYFPSQSLLCSGDTLFRLNVGRTDLLGGDSNAIKHSIQTKLYTLPDATEVIPGHGERTTIGYEKANNMVIRDAAAPRFNALNDQPPATAAAAARKRAPRISWNTVIGFAVSCVFLWLVFRR